MGLRMGASLRERLERIGALMAPEWGDTPGRWAATDELCRRELAIFAEGMGWEFAEV